MPKIFWVFRWKGCCVNNGTRTFSFRYLYHTFLCNHCMHFTVGMLFMVEGKVNFWWHEKLEFSSSFLPVVTTTTSKPIVKTTPQQNRESKNRQQNKTVPACVLAIVNCCSKYDEVVRTPCFEKYNCNGAFFGRSPCSPDIKAAAFREVEKFSRRWIYRLDFYDILTRRFKMQMFYNL